MTDPAQLYAHAEPTERTGAPQVLTFHGTGGAERKFRAAARDLLPGAHVISPRGDVSEGGALRFFRRRAAGLCDVAALDCARAAMSAFVEAHAEWLGVSRVIALGYSNGANIAAAVALPRPAFSATSHWCTR